MIPFSVALEERLQPLSDEDKAEEAKTGASSGLGKITTAGYAGLHVSQEGKEMEDLRLTFQLP